MPYILLCNTKKIVPIGTFLIFLLCEILEGDIGRLMGEIESGEINRINYFVDKGGERRIFYQKNIYSNRKLK